jgi:hypothetical protein
MSITVSYDSTNYVFSGNGANRPNASDFTYSGTTLVLPKTLALRRVYPKKSGTYIANARNYTKLSWAVDVGGESCPIIWEISCSRRADVASADVLITRGILSGLLLDSEVDSFYNSLALPS